MNQPVKYSIILPVRNGGEYVKECVSSILSQTYADFNLLVLDNCSTDDTVSWISALHDPRIIIFLAERPLSIEENWGRIVSLPKNEFITLIGHDDILDEDYLAVMDDLINKNKEAGLYQSHFRYIDKNGEKIRNCKAMKPVLSHSEFLADFLCNKIDTMGTGFMMRSADYDGLGGIPNYPSLLFADFELWINLIGKKYLAVAEKQCFGFRIHNSTTTTSKDAIFYEAYKRFVLFLHKLKDDNESNEVIEKYGPDYIRFYSKALAHRMFRTPKGKRNGYDIKMIKNDAGRFEKLLGGGHNITGNSSDFLKLEQVIDESFILRNLFLLFKKIYKKPVFKNS